MARPLPLALRGAAFQNLAIILFLLTNAVRLILQLIRCFFGRIPGSLGGTLRRAAIDQPGSCFSTRSAVASLACELRPLGFPSCPPCFPHFDLRISIESIDCCAAPAASKIGRGRAGRQFVERTASFNRAD